MQTITLNKLSELPQGPLLTGIDEKKLMEAYQQLYGKAPEILYVFVAQPKSVRTLYVEAKA